MMDHGSIRSWQDFHDAFMKRWSIRKDGRMLLTQLHEIKKKENETVKEFDDRFRKFVNNVLEKIRPSNDALILYCTNAYDGHFGLMLRDKSPTTL